MANILNNQFDERINWIIECEGKSRLDTIVSRVVRTLTQTLLAVVTRTYIYRSFPVKALPITAAPTKLLSERYSINRQIMYLNNIRKSDSLNTTLTCIKYCSNITWN